MTEPTNRKPGELTQLLIAWGQGDARALEQLTPLVYAELRKLAHRYMNRERAGHTLQTTAVIHEAFLRLIGNPQGGWQNRAHFYAIAAQMMRRILVDRARRKARLRHGGGRKRVELTDARVATEDGRADDLIELDEALSKLAEEDRVKAELVKLRYFAGLRIEEAAAVLGISRATADRYWAYARAWLYHEISKGSTKKVDR